MLKKEATSPNVVGRRVDQDTGLVLTDLKLSSPPIAGLPGSLEILGHGGYVDHYSLSRLGFDLISGQLKYKVCGFSDKCQRGNHVLHHILSHHNDAFRSRDCCGWCL
jgi:hypothetical protein